MTSVRRVRVLGLAAVLAASACSDGDLLAAEGSAAERCARAAFVGETNVSTDNVEFYEHDLVLMGPGLQPGARLTEHGRAYEPQFSPDGQRLVFSSGRGYEPGSNVAVGQTAIAVVDVAGGDQVDLTSDHVDRHPEWSPDGRSVAFLRQSEGSGRQQLMLVDPAGGEPAPVVEDEISWFAWWSEREIVLAVYTEGDTLRTEIVHLDTGAHRPIDFGVPEVTQSGYGPPLWSPDRTEFAFHRFPAGSDDRDARPMVVVRDVASGAEHQVPGSNTQTASPLLWTTADSVLFSQNVRGEGQNVALSADGGTADAVVMGPLIADARRGYPEDDNPACAP